METANVLGVNVACVRLEDVLEIIRRVVSGNRRALITHAHITGLNIAYEREWFRQFLNRADLVYCDGMGVKLGARLLGHHIPQRFTLADWIWQLAALAAEQGFSFFFLGNPPGVAQEAAARLRQRYPNLSVQGAYHGFFDKSPQGPENLAVVERINAARVQILLVGFGMPVQEQWLCENWEHLDVNVAITVGALFEYLSGDLKRGPHWLTQNYMEWLVRLFVAPRRYLRRYLRDNPLFLYRILKQKYATRHAPRVKG